MKQKSQWKIHKFGGTSVLNSERYRNVSSIVTTMVPSSRKAVVVSAMKGVTDDLIKTVERAQLQQESYKNLLESVYERHLTEIKALLAPPKREALLEVIEKDFHELREILRGVWLVKTASDKIYDLVSGMGEVWSAQILNAYFQMQGFKTDWLDARQILVVEKNTQGVWIDWKTSQENLNRWQAEHDYDLVTITGFVAATAEGTASTLGRNGSDYSASIFGALFESDEIFIWTDVDGIHSADPRQIPEATILKEMSYNEVTELAYFGAKIVHPATMAPAIKRQIPIWIKNTFNPTFPGTKIHHAAESSAPVKGFSTIDKLSLLNIEGTGMVGVPGVAERLFGALRSAGISVVLISQASSEHSVCLAIPEEQTEKAQKAIESIFFAEIQQGLIQNIQATKNVSILAAVGDNMASSPGTAGQFFTALGRSGVNVRAIAQGSSERNISAVIDTEEAVRALRTVHSAFIVPHQTLSVGLIGPGLIGSTFLRQLKEQHQDLKKHREVDVKIRALANSKKMYLAEKEIPLDQWEELFAKNSVPLDWKKFTEHLKPAHIPHAAVIEATASAALTPLYKEWLAQGLHIISPNKKANTDSMEEYLKIRATAKRYNRHFLYSTNVGAGLPIVQTLRDLISTGDEIQIVQGILSGTLSYIFNQYDGTRPFSEIVKKAKEMGFTEPDPREDLSGQDVVRKLVILAREAGLNLEVGEVEVQGLVPAAMAKIPVEEFMSRLPELDALMNEKMKKAQTEKQILRFVATLTKEGRARVGLEALPETHVFSRVSGTDNIV
ncbi:MAG: bifunctional aspartate kinase/homoserine dehydrogenase I, partial [Pseudobdellovibrionaceae bacterium]